MSFIGNVPAEAYSPVTKDTFSGNGSTTDFTLSIPATTNSVEVFVENVQQEPTDAYTISGTTLSFTAAPVSGTDNIYVIHRGPAVQQVVPPAGVAIDASSVTASGNLIVTGTTTLTDDLSVDTNTLVVDTTNRRVGIGTTSPSTALDVNGTVTASGDVSIADKIIHTGDTNTAIRFPAADTVTVETAGSERVRVDDSGNLLVGQTTAGFSNGSGVTIGDGFVQVERAGTTGLFNRVTTDGTILDFRKDNSTVGSIGTDSTVTYMMYYPSTGLRGGSAGLVPATTGGATSDNSKDLGAPSIRWDDVYATNGTIQTSDRNEKQDIEELSEAERRVAVAAKGLLRKFRWKDKVAEKGEDARIHFGIIAQDLQAAFEAEGLDAGRYAMFISSTWWETYTDVPAIEAQDAVYETQTDDEGNEVQVLVSEAVEAKDAYIRTDTYETEEEAPEGAVKKSRMGVRYSELLAFIIGAL